MSEKGHKLKEVFESHGLRPFRFSDEQKIKNREYIRRLALKVKESFEDND